MTPECIDCGEPVPSRYVAFCEPCEDRRAREERIENGNEYRRKAQEYLDGLRLADTHSSDVEPQS